jgi:6,7-dimethyl-8-ribityllumazine synthase
MMKIRKITPDLNGQEIRIGIVQARFNEEIGHGLLTACLNQLYQLNVDPENIIHITVPGALEIPLALQKLADSNQFDALIALGAIIRGDTYHFEIVSNECAAGITRISLDTDIPIANGVLTTNDEIQAQTRMVVKGAEVARVAIEMANIDLGLESLSESFHRH